VAAPPADLASTLKISAMYSSYPYGGGITLFFFHSPHGPKTGPVEPNFFFAQHVVQFKGTTKFDVIVADAKLVGSAFNSGGKIEPVASLECMHTAHPTHLHVEPEICACNCST